MSKQLRSVQLYAKAWIYIHVGVIRTTLRHTHTKRPKRHIKSYTQGALSHIYTCLLYTSDAADER